jgi:hypothetical protein
MADVEFVRLDLATILPDYTVIDDCVAGERAVKDKGSIYLPIPEEHDKGEENLARGRAYRQRAVFYNVTQRTLDGLVGEVFLRAPISEVPPELESILKDANGDGVSLEQQAKIALSAVLSKGRGGLLVDYPTTSGVTTRQQQLDGEIRPTIVFYQPANIINWKIVKIGGKTLLSLVVLKEVYDRDGADGYTTQSAIRWRVLKLVNGNYVQELYEPSGGPSTNQQPGGVVAVTVGGLAPVKTFNITDANGVPLREIPFTFIGSKDNSQLINPAPMLSLANLNIAHYRNSADYEESVYIVGQPTPVATGLSQQWVKDVLKGVLRFGARGGISLPVGATFAIAQVQPNVMAKEAMDAKEKQMIAIGAKLVEQRKVTQTATEAEINSAAETSVLQSCAGNVEAAFQWALEWCGIFAGVITYADDAEARKKVVKYELNTDFDIMRLTWQDRQQLLKEWQAHGITTDEYRNVLRQAGIASLADDQFAEQQKVELMKDLAQQGEQLKLEAQFAPKPAPGGGTGQNNNPGGNN